MAVWLGFWVQTPGPKASMGMEGQMQELPRVTLAGGGSNQPFLHTDSVNQTSSCDTINVPEVPTLYLAAQCSGGPGVGAPEEGHLPRPGALRVSRRGVGVNQAEGLRRGVALSESNTCGGPQVPPASCPTAFLFCKMRVV